MTGRFWRLNRPPSQNDYDDTFINGEARHPLVLPGIHCGVCGQKWGGGRILPVSCPPEFRQLKELQTHWPILHEQHNAPRDRLLAALRSQGHDIEQLRPGDSFQPVYLRFASRPRYDFLWSTLGSVVVPERVKQLFEQHQVTGVLFCPAVIMAVGKHEPSDPVPMPSTGEPEDIIEEVDKESSPEIFGPLYEMLVSSRSARPPSSKVVHRCPGCGRMEFDPKGRQSVLDAGAGARR